MISMHMTFARSEWGYGDDLSKQEDPSRWVRPTAHQWPYLLSSCLISSLYKMDYLSNWALWSSSWHIQCGCHGQSIPTDSQLYNLFYILSLLSPFVCFSFIFFLYYLVTAYHINDVIYNSVRSLKEGFRLRLIDCFNHYYPSFTYRVKWMEWHVL